MASEIYDKVDITTPDYDYTLTIAAQGKVKEDTTDTQVINRGRDNSRETVTLAAPIHYIHYDWALLSATNCGTIYDLYFDDDKAKRQARSFRLSAHDGHTYVVYFACTISREGNSTNRWGIPGVVFEVKGRIADA